MKSILTKMLPVKKALALVLLLMFFVSAEAQNDVTLHIGDPAPPLKYSKWLKGAPVEAFKNDQLYIMEFWATWCGPCKRAMPHLTKLQKDYEGKVTIIGVGIWEKVKEGLPYESSLPMVTKYVESNSANMGYSVIADNNEEHMGNKWMKASGQGGIPATFIVKEGKIVWIGNPVLLDSILTTIFDGSYDMAAYKVKFDKKVASYKKMYAANEAELKPINDALAAKEYKKAFELMDKLVAEKPSRSNMINQMKFTALLKQGKDQEAIAFGNQWRKEDADAPISIFISTYDADNLSKATYLWTASLFEAAAPKMNPVLFHMLASIYAKGGDCQKAAVNEEKAVKGAKTALKKGEMMGTIMDYTVTEYKQVLARYKKAEKAAKNESKK